VPDPAQPSWPPWPRVDHHALAGYVTPEAGDLLAVNGISAYDATGAPAGRRAVAQAIYDTLEKQGIRYALESYHPSDSLQIIRTPAQILYAPKEGTCLDLALLFCGLCMTSELLPLLIILDGHALAAVSLTHAFRDWQALNRPGNSLFDTSDQMTNVQALRDLIDQGSYLAVECTGFAHSELLGQQLSGRPEADHRVGGVLTFEHAVKAGRQQLDDRTFQFAIDIAVAQDRWRIPVYSPPPGPARIAGGTVAQPTELPADDPLFTGRQPELEEMIKRVSDAAVGGTARPYVIDGMAGVGKTKFAVHLAHQLKGRFPDQQIFLPLNAHTAGQPPVDPADALGALLRLTGATAQQIPPGLEARESMWRDRLAGKKVLLLLDDAVDGDQVRPLLPGSAETLVLITSRHRLSALTEARRITLEMMRPEEAALLYVRIADRPELEPGDPDVDELMQLCGYLPLAIGLMASLLKNHPARTPADQVDDLRSATDRVSAIQAENKRQVAAAFDLSYHDLTPDQQRFFRRLGLHPGTDIDAYAAAALDATDRATASGHLDALYDYHLIDERPGRRYHFHDLIGEHAQALAAADPEVDRAAALDRLLDYYLRSTVVAGRYLARHTPSTAPATGDRPTSILQLPTREKAIDWLEAERLNLAAAAGRAAAIPRPADAIGIPAAIAGFLRVRGYWDQALAMHMTALAAARAASDQHGEANALNDLAGVQQAMGKYRDAAANHNLALDLYRELRDQRGEADTLSDLAIVQRLTGDYGAVTEGLTRAAELYSSLGDQLGEGNVQYDLGIVYRLTGDYTAAADSLNRALDLYDRIDDTRGKANVRNDLGILYRLTGDYTAAADSLNRALELHGRIGSQHGEASALKDLGIVQKLTGDYTAAADSMDKALRLYRGLGDRNCEAETLNNVGELRAASSSATDARGQYEQALGIARDISAPLQEARALEGIGRSLLQEGQAAEGKEDLRQALAIYQRLKSPDAGGVEAILGQLG